MAIKNVAEILQQILEWEKKLKDFYEMMEDYLKNEESRHIATMLHKQQDEVIGVLKSIHLEGKESEFIKSLPQEYQDIAHPHYEIAADSSPMDVLDQILKYEQELEDYYKHLKEKVVYEESRDLFAMLADFKMGQIKKIERLNVGYS